MLKQPVPFVDLRGKTPVDLLRMFPDKAEELMVAARRTYGLPSYLASAMLMPLADKISRRWLEESENPFLPEIDAMADMLSCRGVHALNVSFEWGCTSGIWKTGGTHSLLRVLDWPFPSLGRHVVVALQSGKAGEFYNVTWPGVSGVFTAMAPGRFVASINQAPMRRHNRGMVGDWLINRKMAKLQLALPAAHLLRLVFEQAPSYQAAKTMLIETPIAVPATFVLGGIYPGEACVIERLETSADVIEISADYSIHATNHFIGRLASVGKGWRPREVDSAGRYRHASSIGGHELEQVGFGWLYAPIVNVNTRLCVVADPTTRRLMVQGYEGSLPVTELFHIPPSSYEHQEAV